jgi:hypothetical protein
MLDIDVANQEYVQIYALSVFCVRQIPFAVNCLKVCIIYRHG